MDSPLSPSVEAQKKTSDLSDLRTYQAWETLLDQRALHIRALQPGDRQAMLDGLTHLSAESLYFRFMSVRHQLSEREIDYFTEIDFKNHVALVATLTIDGKETPVGGGRFVVVDPNAPIKHAELAFTVEDVYHGLGIGTHLFHHLEKLAGVLGIRYFDADVHTSNRKMIEVFTHLGLPMHTSREGSMMHIELKLPHA